MTHRQARLLAFIRRYQREHGGVSPSYDEMAAAVGTKSKGSIGEMLDALAHEGRVTRTSHTRGIVVVNGLGHVPDDDLLEEVQRRGLLTEAGRALRDEVRRG